VSDAASQPGLPATFDLRGRVVVVTGGNGGIGLGLASGVAGAGASVAIWARNPDKNRAAVEHLDQLGPGQAMALACDTTDEADVEKAMAATVEALGKVDCLFANAGIMGEPRPFIHSTLEEWRAVLKVNLDGTYLTARAAARHMVDRGEGGALVIVSSTVSSQGSARHEPYATSKTALLGLTRSLAVELARHDIRCNALLPGWTDTAMLDGDRARDRFVEATISRTPMRRWARPDDFTRIAAFLADPSIAFHTGDAVVVDGGYLIY
jgi:NAD(P)-dependent dehydrogenase (short-subunit alcohol dehydrogenase family)